LPIRVEEMTTKGALRFVDFAAISHDGPGKASFSGPIEDFDLEDTEGFGHETAFCYSKEKQAVILQYNHVGPRVGRIQSYLAEFALVIGGEATVFSFDPVLKSEAVMRLNEVSVVKRIDVSVFVPGILASPETERMSLNQLLSNPVVGSSDRLNFSISAGRAKSASLSVDSVKRMVAELLGFKGDVMQLSIVAREGEDAPSEPIDLLNARLEADIPVPRAGRRIARADRFKALHQAFDAWSSNGQLE